jgi:acyl-CoA thioesterase FadM
VAAGYGRDWSIAKGGGWVIRRTEITHHRPAVYGDEVEVRVRVELVKDVRGVRRTWIRRIADGELLGRGAHRMGLGPAQRRPAGGGAQGAG